MNAVTDNPIIFKRDHGGHFRRQLHGQPMALAFDFWASPCRSWPTSRAPPGAVVNPNLGGFPAFLVKKGGLNSGFMIVQYSAAALVSEK